MLAWYDKKNVSEMLSEAFDSECPECGGKWRLWGYGKKVINIAGDYMIVVRVVCPGCGKGLEMGRGPFDDDPARSRRAREARRKRNE